MTRKPVQLFMPQLSSQFNVTKEASYMLYFTREAAQLLFNIPKEGSYLLYFTREAAPYSI